MNRIHTLFLPLLLISTLSVSETWFGENSTYIPGDMYNEEDTVVSDGYFSGEATIVSVKRVYRDRNIEEPYQDCYTKEFYQNNNTVNPLGGAILGGLIGSKLAKKKKTGVVVGALLGASLAQNSQSNSGNIVRREVCETKYRRVTSNRFAHYLVKYKFNGRIFSYTTEHKPRSETIKVRIQVSPE